MSMPINRRFSIVLGGMLLLTARSGLADSDNSGVPAPDDAAELGQQVFQAHGCGYCHENGGRSAGKGPQLMGTSRSDSFITFRIKHGKESRMPAFGSSVTDTQITDVIAYIRSLKE
jgi:mono/diheme cytochrome c family protein